MTTKPEKIGRYEIQEEIGRGGMATVFKAYDPRFERHIAVKVLPPEFMHDPEFRARFNREAKTIAALEHPAIVPVYDYGEEAGLLYLVMRYMPGGSLADRLEHGPLTIEESAEILQRLGSALDRAHNEGIIHRDLKPSNILFDQYGDAFLADFGIVRLTTSDSNLTASGSLVGTPTYMSPEQVYGDKELDGRSDIYALGVILFQMLTGHLPYEADTPAKMMMKHILEPVPQILKNRPDLPPEAEQVVGKALAKERDERFASAADLNAALSTLTQKSKTAAEVQNELATMQLATMQAAITPEMLEPAEQPAEAHDQPTIPPTPIDTAPDDLAEAAASEVLLANIPLPPPPPPKTPVEKAAPPTYPGQRNIPIWGWVMGGLLLVLCLCLTGVIGLIVSNRDDILANLSGTPTAVADNSPTAVAFPLLDENDIATATAKAGLIATREQIGTAAAIAAATSAVSPTQAPPTRGQPTPIPPTIALENPLAATRASLLATRAANSPLLATPANNLAGTRASLAATRSALNPTTTLPAAYGPTAGDLVHEADNVIESVSSRVNLRNFVAQASVLNPYAAAENSWDFGLIFRQTAVDEELRLVVGSDGVWSLNNRSGDNDNFIHEGDVSAYLNLAANGRNDLLLIANEETGYFFLNGEFITTLDLSTRTDFGDLLLGTGFYSVDEQPGAVTRYESFGVWSYVPAYGPQSGQLAHALDGFIKMQPGDVSLQNFVAQAEFSNPYAAATGDWDWGFAFRETENEYWLIVESNGDWSLVDRRPDDDYFINDGSVEGNLATGSGERNTLTLVAQNDIGYLFLNGSFVSNLELGDRRDAGDVAVVAAFYDGDEIADTTTGYTDFTVWPLP